MILSPLGIVADALWYEIPNHAKHIELGAVVVMPNHVHGILVLNDFNNISNDDNNRDNGNDGNNGNNRRDKACLVSTNSTNPTSQTNSNDKTIGQQRFQNQGKNTISSIIGSYKSAVSKHLHRLNFNFAWQPRFYEHIIRNEKSQQKITEYIINNPLNWQTDKLYQE